LEHMSNVSHFNIDKNGVLQGMVIRDILAAASAAPTQAGGACNLHGGGKGCGSPKPAALTDGIAGSVGR
jgi:hypothetical protein